MNRSGYLFLFVLALGLQLLIAGFQGVPGYLDADYYFGGGLQLVRGNGFTEPYLWNYLDDPESLPHPSHGYWMPLASILAALGMWLTGQQTYAAGRLFFILLAALVPPVTAALSYGFSRRKDLAFTSGLLAIFSVFHLAFMPVTDNYGPFMILGALYFISMMKPRPWLWLGVLAGFMALARSDGLIWLALALALALWRAFSDATAATSSLDRSFEFLRFSLLSGLGFLLVMAPWYLRNLDTYGSLMSPGSSRALWLTTYDETFSYPASGLTYETWLASGWDSILRVRIWALGNNIQTMIAAQGHLVLFPLILTGMWVHREDSRARLGALAWVGLFLVMTVIFPFAGVRGSFFHAGAALQPLFWSLAPIGLETAVGTLGRKRGWVLNRAQMLFRIALVQIMILLSIYVVWLRVFEKGWEEGEYLYPVVEQFLVEHGIQPGEPVMVLNSPAYYIMTGRPAIVQPYGDAQTLLKAAEQFGVQFFVFESEGQLKPLKDLYQNPDSFRGFNYLGEIHGARIFELRSGE